MRTTIIALLAVIAIGCTNAARPTPEGTNAAATTPERSQTAIAHSSENQTPPPAGNTAGKTKWTQSGEPIDTTELDTAVKAGEAALAKKPGDEGAKKALGAAYYKRALALTDAKQYASALGDFRRAAKNDPANDDAKGWIDRIIDIYDSINRAYPAEGEEPPPLPFKKAK